MKEISQSQVMPVRTFSYSHSFIVSIVSVTVLFLIVSFYAKFDFKISWLKMNHQWVNAKNT